MKVKYWHLFLIIFSILLTNCKKENETPPNVILILTDDQGFGDLAFHGNPLVKTPSIDKLAGQSINLTNFHVHPYCTPTRASLLTGQYSHRTGARKTTGDKNLMRSDILTLGDHFKSNGYSTALFGKWHIGSGNRYDPSDRGFEEVLTLKGGGPGTVRAGWKGTKWNEALSHNGVEKRYEGYITDVLFSQAINYLKQRQTDKPFFLYLPTFAPHKPWNVPKEWAAQYKKTEEAPIELAYFFAAITRLDYNVGRLMKYMEEDKSLDNTILVFMTDNGSSGGSEFFDGGHAGKKGSSLEHGHRVPCFFYWPAQDINEKRDIEALTADIDWLPTLADLCQLDISQHKDEIDGRSMANLLLGKETSDDWKERIHIMETPKRNGEDFNRNRNVIMKGDWRLIDKNNLTNIKKDPYQKNNLIDQYPELVEELTSEYQKYWDDVSQTDHLQQRFFLGEKSEVLTAVDLSSPTRLCWEQQHIMEGMKTFGKWIVRFARSGEYTFSFYRWPRELNLGLTDSLEVEADPHVSLDDLPVYLCSFGGIINPETMGKKLPIAGVILKINDDEYYVKKDNKNKASIKISIEEGDANIEATFVDENKTKITTVYYLYISEACSPE